MRKRGGWIGIATAGAFLTGCLGEEGTASPEDPNKSITQQCQENGVVDQVTLIDGTNNVYRIDSFEKGDCAPIRAEYQNRPPRNSEVIGGLMIGMQVVELCVEDFSLPPAVIHVAEYEHGIEGYAEAVAWDYQNLPHCDENHG